MREGKEEGGKAVGAMFPRLHVNDVDKGGPRAPPRNKMALYEQFSVPTQRFSSGAAPPSSATTTLPSASSSQACGQGRSVFSPFYVPHAPSYAAEKVLSHSDVRNSNMACKESERRSLDHVNNSALKVRGPVAECSSQHSRGFSKRKSSCTKKLGDDDDDEDDDNDFRVPTFVQSSNAAHSKNDGPAKEAESLTPFRLDSPKKNCSDFGKSLDQTTASDTQSRQNVEQNNEHRVNPVLIKKHKKQSVSHAEMGERFAERPKNLKASSVPECTSMLNALEKSCKRGTDQYEEISDTAELGGQRCLNNDVLIKKGNALKVRNESCCKASLRDCSRSQNAANSCDKSDDRSSGSLELGHADRKDDVSEGSMVDAVLGLEISPDDVVGLIGAKQFWKARRAIINQQRVFAVQVFELHRLIKVQKLIAESPHMLLEDYTFLDRTLPKVPAKNLLPDCSTKSQPQILKHKDIVSQKASKHSNLPKENSLGAQLPSNENAPNSPDKGIGQVTRSVAYSGNPTSLEGKPSAWCFHPPANQWLVPVMSPSEGLIYKPFAGPYTPAAGFVAPVYGSCGPFSLPPTYGVPASHQQQNMGVLPGAPAIAPNYFPAQYGLPVVNHTVSASAVEQVSPMVGSWPHVQTDQHSRSSCNMSNPRSEAFSDCVRRFQVSKNSEIQGSTASSPCKEAQGDGRDALPLFPVAPEAEGSTQRLQSCDRDSNQHRVIKVVPHKARSATESVARIFRSIQKERQQYDT